MKKKNDGTPNLETFFNSLWKTFSEKTQEHLGFYYDENTILI